MAAADHHHAHDAHQTGASPESTGLAELLDLDGEVLSGYLDEATDWVRRQASDSAHYRILDLGCGTGTATIALAQRFASAEVIAVDESAEMLTRVRTKAGQLGLTDRIHTVQADLNQPWPAIGALDVVWASMSLHHLADPDRVLKDVFGAMNRAGLLAVAEMEAQVRFLPDDIGLGRPGLEERCHEALALVHTEQVPHLGADWADHLQQAGFVIDAERVFAIDLAPPPPAATGRYAQAVLGRIRSHLHDRLAEDDLATLDTLIAGSGPRSVLHRGDLRVRTTRTVWIGRRP
jgi:ubiquinone/menaquinone biosynthesis C-methylase UbiE